MCRSEEKLLDELANIIASGRMEAWHIPGTEWETDIRSDVAVAAFYVTEQHDSRWNRGKRGRRLCQYCSNYMPTGACRRFKARELAGKVIAHAVKYCGLQIAPLDKVEANAIH